MVASYVGQMAPSGRIVITATLQAGDEMRRVQRIAYRIRQLQKVYRGFATDSRTLWQNDTLWQPLRFAVEKLLVCYDWAESFVALNLVLKPMIDEMFMNHLSDLALREGDYLTGEKLHASRLQRLHARILVHRVGIIRILRSALHGHCFFPAKEDILDRGFTSRRTGDVQPCAELVLIPDVIVVVE
jgi:hypothetical protein